MTHGRIKMAPGLVPAADKANDSACTAQHELDLENFAWPTESERIFMVSLSVHFENTKKRSWFIYFTTRIPSQNH